MNLLAYLRELVHPVHQVGLGLKLRLSALVARAISAALSHPFRPYAVDFAVIQL